MKIGNYFIDGRVQGAPARFLNHSCSPNCILDTITTATQQVAIFRAARRILPYEELTFDYNWQLQAGTLPTPCLCNHPTCKGTIEHTQVPRARPVQTNTTTSNPTTTNTSNSLLNYFPRFKEPPSTEGKENKINRKTNKMIKKNEAKNGPGATKNTVHTGDNRTSLITHHHAQQTLLEGTPPV